VFEGGRKETCLLYCTVLYILASPPRSPPRRPMRRMPVAGTSVEVGWKKCERSLDAVLVLVVDRAGSDVSRYPGSSDELLEDWHSYPSRTQEAEKAQP